MADDVSAKQGQTSFGKLAASFLAKADRSRVAVIETRRVGYAQYTRGSPHTTITIECGTDHGTGSTTIIFGDNINSGKVIAE